MQVKFFQTAVLLAAVCTSLCCEGGRRDGYLKSLRLVPEVLSPIDSIDLEVAGIFSPTSLIKRGDWFLMRDTKSEYNITAFNPTSGNVLHFLPYGRGIGEISMKGRLSEPSGLVSVHDFGTNTVVSLKVRESIEQKEQVLDTISQFVGNMTYVNPLFCKSGFIASSFKDARVWYYLIDTEGKELSSVPAISDGLLRKEEDPAMSMVNSILTVSPDGDKVCSAAMGLTALSFSSIDGGLLKENHRVEIPGQEDSKTITNFTGLCSDNEYVYVLYSGKPFNTSRNESEWLVVYNWRGKPIKCYNLTHSVFSVAVEGNNVYCTTDSPSSSILVYQLDGID